MVFGCGRNVPVRRVRTACGPRNTRCTAPVRRVRTACVPRNTICTQKSEVFFVRPK